MAGYRRVLGFGCYCVTRGNLERGVTLVDLYGTYGIFHGIGYGTPIYLYDQCLHTNIHTSLSSSSDLRGSTQSRLWEAIRL
jgi:hypothetical protein